MKKIRVSRLRLTPHSGEVLTPHLGFGLRLGGRTSGAQEADGDHEEEKRDLIHKVFIR